MCKRHGHEGEADACSCVANGVEEASGQHVHQHLLGEAWGTLNAGEPQQRDKRGGSDCVEGWMGSLKANMASSLYNKVLLPSEY